MSEVYIEKFEQTKNKPLKGVYIDIGDMIERQQYSGQSNVGKFTQVDKYNTFERYHCNTRKFGRLGRGNCNANYLGDDLKFPAEVQEVYDREREQQRKNHAKTMA